MLSSRNVTHIFILVIDLNCHYLNNIVYCYIKCWIILYDFLRSTLINTFGSFNTVLRSIYTNPPCVIFNHGYRTSILNMQVTLKLKGPYHKNVNGEETPRGWAFVPFSWQFNTVGSSNFLPFSEHGVLNIIRFNWSYLAEQPDMENTTYCLSVNIIIAAEIYLSGFLNNYFKFMFSFFFPFKPLCKKGGAYGFSYIQKCLRTV